MWPNFTWHLHQLHVISNHVVYLNWYPRQIQSGSHAIVRMDKGEEVFVQSEQILNLQSQWRVCLI